MKKILIIPKEIFYISMTYVGAIVGAGFASGQEVLKFFSFFGPLGILGILLAASLFSIFGSVILLLGKKLNARSYQEILNHVCGRILGKVMDYAMFVILFGMVGVMLAGAGAIFKEYLGLPYNFGVIFTSILVIVVVFNGLEGVIGASVILMPFMIIIGLLVSLPSVIYHGVFVEAPQMPSGILPNWFLAAVLYAAYNLMVSMSVLAPLGNNIQTKKPLLLGGLFGGFLIGVVSLLMNLAILAHLPEITGQEMPMLYISHQHGTLVEKLYCIVIWAEIFLTIIGNIYGNAIRLSCLNKRVYKPVVLILMVLAMFISQLGFSYLIDRLYPFFGVISLLFLVALTFKVFLYFKRLRF